MKRFIIGSAVATVLFLSGPSARADEIKRALFVLGVHMEGAEGVAIELTGDPIRERPGGIALMKRNLKDSLDVATVLKLPTAGLKSLLDDVEAERVSFAEMAKRMGDMRLEMATAAGKSINPGAGAFFIMGVHLSGGERISLGAAGFARKDKPGTEGLIDRQLVRLADGTPTIMVTLKPVLEIQANMAKGASFQELANQFGKLRLAWQEELAKQPGFGVVTGKIGGPGKGKVVFSQAGNLTKNDPKDSQRKDMFAKIHTVELKAGQVVVIDLESGDGAATMGNFDTWLRVEDAGGTKLAEDDDSGDGYNARLEFNPPRDGTYRLVVTSYQPNAEGPYTLTVRLKE